MYAPESAGPSVTPGTLYVCATPIGNLEDITLRVLRLLAAVDVIAAEDTRHTRKLLRHYDIETPLISLHEHNEAQRTPRLLARLADGETVALVSDAGMPGISDPGGIFIREAIRTGVAVTVAPGATAFVTGLVGSGLPTTRFAFEGFLPRRAGQRRAALRALADETRTLVFYEAPHRVRAVLEDMEAVLGPRDACVARELTKTYEEWARGTLAELVQTVAPTRPRGEYVIVVAGAPAAAAPPTPDDEGLARMVAARMEAGADKKAAIRAVADELGVARRIVYRAALPIKATGGGFGRES